MKPIRANIKTGSVMQRFEWIKSHVLGLAGLSICLCFGSAFSADTANYDTAWTYTYDGGVAKNGHVIEDKFADVKILPNGDALLAGETKDSSFYRQVLLSRMSPSGAVKETKALKLVIAISASSLLIKKNGEIWVGGEKFGGPLLLRFDASLNLLSSFWYYDSLNERSKLLRPASLQSLIETADGRVIAVGGDVFPYNNNSTLNNFAVWMEFDSLGVLRSRVREWLNETPFELAGWSIVESASGELMMGGNAAVFSLKGDGDEILRVRYSFSLQGVGTVLNKVSRVRKLSGGKLIAIGQAYEEDCWTKYKRLSYDGWWSFLSSSGTNDSWNTAGEGGVHDVIFDAAQLTDGRIAFIGVKGSTPDSGAWMFVTDSTAKTVQWQKQFNLPGLDAGIPRNNLVPYTVVATPDSGFIVVGKEGATNLNDNGFAFKVVPKPMPVSIVKPTARAVRSAGMGKDWVFAFTAGDASTVQLELFDLQGRMAGSYMRQAASAGPGEFRIDVSHLKKGMYVWQLKSGAGAARGMAVLQE